MKVAARKKREERIVQLIERAQILAADEALRRAIAISTGLTEEGVRFGFEHSLESIERFDSDSVFAAAEEAEEIHVILSANVFVAPLRALVLAMAGADRVTVRHSTREPHFTEALLQAAQIEALSLTPTKSPEEQSVGEIHIYGKDETIAAVRAVSRVRVRGHGAGFGVAVVDRPSHHEMLAHLLARDVALFDQRGCLSPRIVFAVGEAAFARSFAEAVHQSLLTLSAKCPRGALSSEEREASTRFLDLNAFAGQVFEAEHHAVGILDNPPSLTISPTGRHVQVVRVAAKSEAVRLLAPLRRFITTIGASDPLDWAFTLSHARISEIGEMQSPPLDGPVDRRR